MNISKETKVGLFMVIALGALYLGFNFLKGIDFFSTTTRYYAIYDNVDKLMASNQVYLNGYAVGRVSKIGILKNSSNKVLVELSIDSDVSLTDSTVAILSSDFLGNKSILLDIPEGNHPVLEKGDTLISILEKGLADLLEKADPVADNIQAALRKLTMALDNLVSNSKNLDSIFNSFKGSPALLNRTMSNANRKIDSLGTNIDILVENLNSRVTELKPVLANVRSFSDSLKSIEIGQTMAKIREMATNLNQTVDKFGKGDNTLGKLMTEDSLYVNLNNLLLRMDTLANHLNTNPKHFFGPLGKSQKQIERELEKSKGK